MTVKSEIIRPFPQVHPGVRVSPTSYFTSPAVQVGATNGAVSANTAYYQPIILPGQTVNRIGINVTTGAAGNCRLALYTNGQGVPSTLILDCGVVDTTNIATVLATIADTVLPVEYVWMASVFDATPTCTIGTVSNSGVLGSQSLATGNRGLTATFNYAAWTAAAPVTSLAMGNTVPMMALRRA